MAGSRPSTSRILTFEVRKYSEEDFVIPAQDTKGHSERIWFRTQPGTMRDLKVILASKKFPFRTMGDIGRFCVHLGVDLLKKLEPIPSVSAQVEAIIKIVRDEEFHQEFIATFEQVDRAISRYVAANEQGRAMSMLLAIRDEVKRMPGGYWREKYWKELDKKYGHMIRAAGADLGHGVEDGDDQDDDGGDGNKE